MPGDEREYANPMHSLLNEAVESEVDNGIDEAVRGDDEAEGRGEETEEEEGREGEGDDEEGGEGVRDDEEGDGDAEEVDTQTYSIKVDGEELELELNDEERDSLIQQGYAFQEKTRALAETKREVAAQAKQLEEAQDEIREFFGDMQRAENIVPQLERMGFPVRQAIEQAALQMIEEAQLPEKDRLARARKRQEQELAEREQRLAEQERAREEQEESARWQQRLERWVPKALEEAGLDDSRKWMKLIGVELGPTLNSGEPVSYQDIVEAAERVAEDWGTPKEEPEKKLKVKKRNGAKPPPARPKRSGTKRGKPVSRQPDYIRSEDFFDDLRKGIVR